MSAQIFHDHPADRAFRPAWFASRVLIYAVLLLWAFLCLFPIFWTITTTFKAAPDVMKGNLMPYVDFQPKMLGLRSLGLSPETIFNESTVREEFLKRFWNSTVVAVGSSTLAVMLGSCAAYGLSRFSYRFGFMRNPDILFFFLSQLILPPVVLALPFLVLWVSAGRAALLATLGARLLGRPLHARVALGLGVRRALPLLGARHARVHRAEDRAGAHVLAELDVVAVHEPQRARRYRLLVVAAEPPVLPRLLRHHRAHHVARVRPHVAHRRCCAAEDPASV